MPASSGSIRRKARSRFLDGKEYPLTDTYFPTIDWKKPYELSAEEKDVMERLDSAFRNCEKLQNHVRLLLDKGGLYKTYNGQSSVPWKYSA